MKPPVIVEVIGLNTTECSPFPCDANRTCGLSDCYPSGSLIKAFDALKTRIHDTYGDKVSMKLTLIDERIPDHIRTILENNYPPLPIILVNGKLTKIGRIVSDRILNEIELCLQ